ncbi:MAG: DcaP family trimeric outer membrane transporter, partial [Rikenellaceae bacterium]
EKIGDIKLYVEIDFRGSSNTIRMRHAYFTVKGFTFGQTWSIMTDGAANAPTIDVQGVNARSYFRVPQISYKHSLTDQISMGASIEMQTITITSPSGEIESAVSKAPDFGLFAQSKGALGHIRFSTILRSMPYIYNNEKQNQFGWGVQLTGTLNATKSLRFYGQSIYGHGIGRYINDLMSQSMDVVESVSSPYDVNALPMYGASIGLKYDFTKKLYLSACYGSVKVMDSDDVLSSSDFRSSEFISTTLFYAPIKSLLFGFEYLHGARINVDKSTGVANKINLMTRYLF